MNLKNLLLEALEEDRKGNWDEAHLLVQPIRNEYAYWIHAYLHRKELDLNNARHWYSMVGKSVPSCTYVEEREEILRALEQHDPQ